MEMGGEGGGQRVKLNLISQVFPPRCHVYSSEFQVPTTSGNFTKRLTAKINNKEMPPVKPLTLWNKRFACAI